MLNRNRKVRRYLAHHQFFYFDILADNINSSVILVDCQLHGLISKLSSFPTIPPEDIKLPIPKPPIWGAEDVDVAPPVTSFIVVPFSNADFNSNITLAIRKVKAEDVTT